MKKSALILLIKLWAAALMSMSSAYAYDGLKEDRDNFFVSTDQKYEKIIDRVIKASHNNSYTGSILVATDDEIILYGGPKAVTTSGAPADLHTTYDIGSCSKTFTAVSIFQLIETGQISLDDPVSKFFPEYETGRDITVYHLLHMRSGIKDYVNDPMGFWGITDENEIDQFIARFYRDDVSDKELLKYLYAAPLYFTPGTNMSYSNTDYHLLALIIEQITGMKFCDYVQAHIFEICGLEHTTSMAIGDETSVPKMFSDIFEIGIVNESGYSMSPNQERGAGGIHTCTADLWSFDRMLLSGQLVSRTSLEEIMHFDMDYGCGLCPYGKRAYGHSGRNATYTTQNVMIESEQFGRVYYIASTSSDAGTYGLEAITKAILSQLGST